MDPADRALGFLELNRDPGKPRTRGITEVRGPYYTPLGRRQLQDLLETVGWWVDSLKWSGGSFALMPRERVRELNELCHEHDVRVSTGGFLEHVLTRGRGAVDRYLEEVDELGFDTVEVSAGFVSLPVEDHVRLVRRVVEAGFVPKPELGVQFGAGGDTPTRRLGSEGQASVEGLLRLGERFLEDEDVPVVMVESEGLTENVPEPRWGAVERIGHELGVDRVMFEAADPDVFAWHVKRFGPEVNLFVDHSQVVQLEALRCGIWGTMDTWGRIHTYDG